jgi:hypothetical protein
MLSTCKLRIAIAALVVTGVSACLSLAVGGGKFFNEWDSLLDERMRPGGKIIEDGSGYILAPKAFGYRDISGADVVYIDVLKYEDDIGEAGHFTPIKGYHLFVLDDGWLYWMPEYAGFELVSSVVSSGTLIQLWCDDVPVIRTRRLVGETMEVGSLELTDSRWCNARNIIGARMDDGEAVIVPAQGGTPLNVAVTVDGLGKLAITTTAGSAAVPTTPARDKLVFVEERTADVLAAVYYDNGTWRYREGGVTFTATDMPYGEPAGIAPVRRQADGQLRIETLDGMFAWDVDGSGTAQRLATSPQPTINAIWAAGPWSGGAIAEELKPNERAPNLNVPVASQTRVVAGDTMSVLDVPTTPCVVSEQCREIGESDLIAIVGPSGKEYAIYALWSWNGTDDGGGKRVVGAPIKHLPDGCTPAGCTPPGSDDGGGAGDGGDPVGGGDPTPADADVLHVVGSCSAGTSHKCVDYTGSSYVAATVQQDCESGGGVFLPNGCAAGGRVGRCIVDQGLDTEYIINCYPGANTTCSGTWIDG